MIVRPLVVIAACALFTAAAAAQDTPPQQNTAREPGSVTAPAQAPAADPAVATTGVAAPAAVPAPAAAPAAVIDAGTFRIGPEDILDISVWRSPEASRVMTVRPDGYISLPLVNDIKAAGLTPTELRTLIIERLASSIPNAEVSVIVREIHSAKVSVVGAVKMPGWYEMNSTATVLDLIARAQGLTEFARRNEIVVHRNSGGRTGTIPFNYNRVAEGKDQNLTVQPGDIIYVP